MHRKQLAAWAAGLVLLMPALLLADSKASDNWNIEIDGKAKSAGTLGFTLRFEADQVGATAASVDITITVPNKARKKDVAEMISNNFRGKLGDNNFKIRKDGDEVIVKAKGETPDFMLELTNNTVQGISVKLND